MKKKNAYLLFELLCSMVILCTTAVAITQAFSKQMEITGLAFQQMSLHPFLREKIFEIEKKLKQTPEAWEKMKALSGDVPETSLKWDLTLKVCEKYPALLQADFCVTGLKNERSVSLTMFMKLPEMSKEDSRGSLPSEGNFS